MTFKDKVLAYLAEAKKKLRIKGIDKTTSIPGAKYPVKGVHPTGHDKPNSLEARKGKRIPEGPTIGRIREDSLAESRKGTGYKAMATSVSHETGKRISPGAMKGELESLKHRGIVGGIKKRSKGGKIKNPRAYLYGTERKIAKQHFEKEDFEDEELAALSLTEASAIKKAAGYKALATRLSKELGRKISSSSVKSYLATLEPTETAGEIEKRAKHPKFGSKGAYEWGTKYKILRAHFAKE